MSDALAPRGPIAKIGVVLLRNYSGGATNLGRAAQALVAELRLVTAAVSVISKQILFCRLL